MNRQFLVVLALLTSSFAIAYAQMQTPAEREVIKVEEAWTQAELKGDAATLGRILADDFVNSNEDGIVQNKAQTLAGFSSGKTKVATETMDDVNVRIYGDVAVVTLRIVQTGASGHKNISGNLRVTDVLVHRDGGWQCVAEHASRIAK